MISDHATSDGERGDDVGGADGKRRAKRDSLFLGATIDKGDGVAHDVRVRNLSATGMMIDGDIAFDDGASVTATLRGIGAIAGRIAWVVDRRAGVAFESEIDPEKARKPVASGTRPVGFAIDPASTKRPGLRSR